MLVQYDGFDLYNGTGANTGLQAKYALNGGTQSLQAGRFGGQCVQVTTGAGSGTGNYGTIARTFPAAYASFTFAFAHSTSNISTTHNRQFLKFRDAAGAVQLSLRNDSGGGISVFRGDGTTLLPGGSTAAGVLAVSTFHFIEFTCTIHDTTGSVTMKIDGTTVLTLSGIDTKASSLTECSSWEYGSHSDSSNGGWTFKIDDWYLTDGATLGERRVETIRPTSDVAANWARSAGADNYALVDDTTANGDTDYVEEGTVSDTDTYGLGDLSSTPTTIDAVQLVAFARKTDAGSRAINLQAKSGATTSDGTNYNLGSGYARIERLLTQDPNTSSAWTASGVNALQAGPKLAA